MNRFNEYLEQISPHIQRDTRNLGREWKSHLLSEITVPEYLHPVLTWFEHCGKGTRGSLVHLAAESFNNPFSSGINSNIKKYAALVELLQNALLVHDDVMDHSNWRRNGLSVPAECASRLHAHNYANAEEKGTGISIALGDHLISWLQQKLVDLTPHEKITKLHSLYTKYQTSTMAGQIQDVANLDLEIDKESITNLYASKTGAYTFTLPLVLGYVATIHTIDFSITLLLECIGQSLGIIMQGLDDEVGFKNKANSYHELATDLENHQPSLWLALMLPLLSHQEKVLLEKIWWGGMVTRDETNYVKQLYEKYQIHQKAQDIYRTEARLAHELINELDLEPKYVKIWHGLVQNTLNP